MLKGKPSRVTQSTGHNKEKHSDERGVLVSGVNLLIEKVCLRHVSVLNTEMFPDFRNLECGTILYSLLHTHTHTHTHTRAHTHTHTHTHTHPHPHTHPLYMYFSHIWSRLAHMKIQQNHRDTHSGILQRPLLPILYTHIWTHNPCV